jgi:hypothetical protein
VLLTCVSECTGEFLTTVCRGEISCARNGQGNHGTQFKKKCLSYLILCHKGVVSLRFLSLNGATKVEAKLTG